MGYASDKAKGLFFLFFTSVCWVGSSALAKIIYTEADYEKPFMLVYLSDALNFLYFLPMLGYRCNKTATTYDNSYIKIAIITAPIIFISNYFFYEGIALTSIASAQIITNCSFVFIFLLSMPILGARFSVVKFLCVISAFGGLFLVQLMDSEGSEDEEPKEYALVGDLISVVSAILYSSYAITLNKLIPDESKFNWFGFFGVLGVTILIMFIPFFFILHYCGVEEFELPPWNTFLILMVNAIFGTVIPNYTWGRSALLLSPLIMDLGLGLTLPMGLIVSYFIEGTNYTFYYIMGSVYIMGAFMVISIYDYNAGKNKEERKSMLKDKYDPICSIIKVL